MTTPTFDILNVKRFFELKPGGVTFACRGPFQGPRTLRLTHARLTAIQDLQYALGMPVVYMVGRCHCWLCYEDGYELKIANKALCIWMNFLLANQ